MGSHAVAVVRSASLVLLLASAAACGAAAASPPATAPAPVPAGSSIGQPSLAPRTAPPDTPSPATPGTEPPAAVLDGLRGAPPAGDLGTYSWGGLISDAPWITTGSGGDTTPGTGLAVTFDPDAEAPVDWHARWARIAGSAPGTPVDGGSGTGPAVELVAPDRPGSWSLQLTATFGPGRSATWYWQVDVVDE